MKKYFNLLLLATLVLLFWTSCEKEQFYTMELHDRLIPVFNEANYIQDEYSITDFNGDSVEFLIADAHEVMAFNGYKIKYLGGYVRPDRRIWTEVLSLPIIYENDLDHNDTIFTPAYFDAIYAIFEITDSEHTYRDTMIYGNDMLDLYIHTISEDPGYPGYIVSDFVGEIPNDFKKYKINVENKQGLFMYFFGSIPFYETNVDSLKLIYVKSYCTTCN